MKNKNKKYQNTGSFSFHMKQANHTIKNKVYVHQKDVQLFSQELQVNSLMLNEF